MRTTQGFSGQQFDKILKRIDRIEGLLNRLEAHLEEMGRLLEEGDEDLVLSGA